jgi:hypothetical protein
MHSNSFIRIGVRRSSEGALDGAAISPHSQAATLNHLTPQSLICKQRDNNLRGMIHSNLTHTSRSPTLGMQGHGEEEDEEEDPQVVKSGIDL